MVENERIEYKNSWNPENIIHSICAFANDIEGQNGGYIILGIQDENGMPGEIVGIPKDSVDGLNAKLTDLCNRIDPRYLTSTDYRQYKGKGLFIIHAPCGNNRPYTCPVSLSVKKPERASYIRKMGRTLRADASDVRFLTQISSIIPFEDQANRTASITDLDLGLMTAFLVNTKSPILEISVDMDVKTLAESLRLLQNSPEGRLPTNLSLMFFNRHPEDFFPRSWIEIAFKPDPTGTNMKEQRILGPIDQQIRNALTAIEDTYIQLDITKNIDRPESDRHYNYPLTAIREAVVNAVYHRSYDSGKPVKIDILEDRMEITSAPGPDPSITDEDLQNGRLKSRYNRNARIGDFLKSLGLAEGQGTGIPLMQKAMKLNGSGMPRFETDAGRTYLTVVLPINPKFVVKKTTAVPSRATNDESKEAVLYNTIISMLRENGPMSIREIAAALGLKSPTTYLRTFLNIMIVCDRIAYLYPESPRSAKQKYMLAEDERRGHPDTV